MTIEESIPQMMASLMGGLVGGFAGFVASLLMERRNRREKIRNIASALIGEIGALVHGFETRYLDMLRINVEEMENTALFSHFHVQAQQDFMPIFHSLGSEIGLLPSPLPRDLVAWYTDLAVGLERTRAMYDLITQNGTEMLIQLNHLTDLQYQAISGLVERSADLLESLNNL